MADFAKWDAAIQVPVELIEANPWNPNQMTEEMFQKLLAEIQNTGFDEPILVVPHPEKPGHYRVVNGEHRWKAVQVLQWKTVPVVVKNLSELDQKTMTVRRNLLHGDLDRLKFTELVNDVINNHGMAETKVHSEMGFLDEQEFVKHLVTQKAKVAQDMAEDAKKSAKMVDNLSYLLNEIFTQFGDTVPQGFVFFMHKSKMHLMVQMDKEMEELLGLAVNHLKATGKDINDFLGKALSAAMLSAEPQPPADVKYS
jgi:hypothetical protein